MVVHAGMMWLDLRGNGRIIINKKKMVMMENKKIQITISLSICI